jgi:hypothetical protein
MNFDRGEKDPRGKKNAPLNRNEKIQKKIPQIATMSTPLL